MRKILVIQHVAHEILGTLNPMLKNRGFRIRYVNFARTPDIVPCLDGYAGLIILGGPMGVYENSKYPHLKEELRLIDQALKKEVPILGICLGAQLLAHALGANVFRHKHNEAGWHKIHLTPEGKSDSLFSGYNETEWLFQLHSDTFDLPMGVRHLAWSDLCEGQAFRYKEKAYGLQFHLEVDKKMVHRWLHVADIKNRFFDSHHAEATRNSVLEETDLRIQRSLRLSESTFNRFIDIFNLPEKQILLGSEHGNSLHDSTQIGLYKNKRGSIDED